MATTATVRKQSNLAFFLILAVGLLQLANGQSCPSRCRRCTEGKVDCSSMSLTAPPKTYPRGTIIINLANNHLRVLGSRSFDTSNTVEMLQLNGNKLTSLKADSFSFFPKLMSLDLGSNMINHVQKRTFRNMAKLQSLVITRNKISSLDFLEDATALQQLNLAENKIRALRENDFATLTLLQSLDLRDNLISSIHSGTFSKLRNLRSLYLNKNPLVTTPQFRFGSEILQVVDFTSCQLTNVPSPLPASVYDLRLGHNKISRVYHTDLRNITELQLLGLNDNNLAVLDDGALDHLQNLKEVWLRGNNLVYVPRDLPNSVSKIHMDMNRLAEIEVGVFKNQSRLEYLSVENNEVRRILPNTFSSLQFLNGLNFQGNRLEVLQSGAFANLGTVSTIKLSSNPEMRSIQAGAFQNLAGLTKLHLSYISTEQFELQDNFLAQMLRLQVLDLMGSPGLADAFMAMIDNPAKVPTVLQSLTYLDMSFNNLFNVSSRVRQLFPSLTSFFLDQNPFICMRSLKWLKDWMVSSPQIRFYQFEDLKCNSPVRLYGRSLRSIQDSEWADADEIENDRLLGRSGPELAYADDSSKVETQAVPQKPEQKSGRGKQPNEEKKEKQKGKDKGNNKNKKKDNPKKAENKQKKGKRGSDKKKPTKSGTVSN